MNWIILFLTLSVIVPLQGNQQFSIINLLNNVLLQGRYHGALLGSLINSSYQFTLLGAEDVCAEIQEIVRDLKKEMNIERCVYVKKMNAHAFNLFGYENAFATHNSLFIDEPWVLNLDYESKRCLLAHELSHIQHCDIGRHYMLHGMLIGVSLHLSSINIISTALLMVSIPFILAFHKRYREKSADYRAAEIVGKEKMHQFLKSQLVDEEHDGLKNWFLSFFSTYPHLKERIDCKFLFD